MGNTSLKESTREALQDYRADDQSYDDAVVSLLAAHREMELLRHEVSLLRLIMNDPGTEVRTA